jgi:hypothetical protein
MAYRPFVILLIVRDLKDRVVFVLGEFPTSLIKFLFG